MTFFGVIWILVITWAFLKKDIKYMYAMLILFMTFQCSNVFVIGGIGIGPQVLTSILFILKVLCNKRIVLCKDKRIIMYILMSLMLGGISLISCVYNGILSEKIFNIIMLFVYIMCFVNIILAGNVVDINIVYNIIRNVTIFLLVVGVLQVLTTTGILPIRSILKVLFYNDTSPTVYFHHLKYKRIMSTFMEPSYYSVFLVGAFYYFLSIGEKWKENCIILIVIFIEMIGTMSSTAYVAFAVVGLIFILLQRKISVYKKALIIIVATLLFMVVYFGFYNVLDTVIFSKTSSGSYVTRTYMNKAALVKFKDSIILGKGYKSVRGSSIIYSILGEIGILGLIIYSIFNLMTIIPLFVKNKKGLEKVYSENIATQYAVISAVVCQIIACPDLDLCIYWLWAYVLANSIRIGKN